MHGRIYAAAAQLIDSGHAANPVTLKDLFEQDEALKEIGGFRYLTKLAGSVVTFVNAADYARQIHDAAQRRAIIEACRATEERAFLFSLADGAPEILAEHERALSVIGDGSAGHAPPISAGDSAGVAIELAGEAYKNEGRITGVTTGLADLDELLGGLQPSDLVILAGRPSMGKTALAQAIGCAAAKSFMMAGIKKTVAEFSLEMPHWQLAQRHLASITGIEMERIKKGRLGRDEFGKLHEARQELDRLPMLTVDTSSLTVADIRARAKRIARQRGLGLIIVDHIGLMRGSIESKRNGETAVVSEITRELKALAKDLACPVLALSQLNRDLERRDDKRPQLSDLRQSGSIEQDADVIMFVYREHYYLSRSAPIRKPGEKDDAFNIRQAEWQVDCDKCKNTADIIVSKHRNGPIGGVKAFFDGARSVFENLSQMGMPL